MSGIIYFAAGIAFLTTIAIQVIKSVGIVPTQYAAAASIGVGILMGALAFAVPELRTEMSLLAHLVGGALTGASAAGIYDIGKQVKESVDNPSGK